MQSSSPFDTRILSCYIQASSGSALNIYSDEYLTTIRNLWITLTFESFSYIVLYFLHVVFSLVFDNRKIESMCLLYAISYSRFLYNIVSESIPHQETFLKNSTCRSMIFLVPETHLLVDASIRLYK